MVSRCQKLLGMFLSFTLRKEGQCAPVKVRVEPAFCSYVTNSAGVKKPALPEMVVFMHSPLAVSYWLFIIPSRALGKEGLLPSPPFRSTCVTLPDYRSG